MIRKTPRRTTTVVWTTGKKGDYNKAIADCTEAIRLNPQLAEAYAGRGCAYVEKGDHDKAISDFTEAIHLNPKHVNAYYNNRGIAYQRKGEKDKAEEDFAEDKKLGHKPP